MKDNSEQSSAAVGPTSARFADIFRFVGVCFYSGFLALGRRIFRGASRPSWGWAMEFIVGLQRGTYSLIPKFGVQRYHCVLEAIIPTIDSAGTRVEVSTEKAAPGHWLIPEEDKGAVILYFHGGGYVYGSTKTHGKMIGTLARATAARTLSVEYRLAPGAPQPAAIEDACGAYRQLVKSGIQPEKIVLAGDSSGGGLILSALIALRDAGDAMPAAGVAISPWVDLQCAEASFDSNAGYDPVSRQACLTAAEAYLNGSDPRAPAVSPLFAELAGLPPLLIHAGEVEVLVDQIRKFATKAQAAGVEVHFNVFADMVHVWHMLIGFTPRAQDGIDEIAQFINSQIRRASESAGS